MISRSFNPFIYADNFRGVNCKDSSENMLSGEWDESSINIMSDPQGALCSRTGFSSITVASIGTVTAWCGFYHFPKLSGGSRTDYYIGGGSDGKLYKYASSAYEELFSGIATTDGANERYSFFTLDNTAVICHKRTTPLVYTGTGSAATFVSSVTADWGLEWQRYPWFHSTVDPRLLYYGELGDPDSQHDATFLNFDEDAFELTGACKQGDDMLVGKENSLFRIQYRGTSPLYKKYRVPSAIGPVNHWVMKEIPDQGRVVFLAADFNFYIAEGDSVRTCGDNIQNYIRDGVNSRLKYAVSGLLLNRNQYWCSFTYVSGSTANDRTVVMDWSRPYADRWGKIQYPWFIYTIGANCFAEISTGGKGYLYHGGYTGKMYKDDTGTNDDGSAFSTTYVSKRESHGDPTLEKKWDSINLSYDRSGDWDLLIRTVCDGNAATEKVISQNLLTGLGYRSLFDVAKFDEDYFSSESDADTSRDIGRMGKLVQVSFGTTGLDESWRLYSYVLHAKALRRGRRTRENE